jgi:hypothetical protein
LTWPWTAGWVPIISRACMLGSLLEGWPQTRRPLSQAAAIENVLAFGNIPAPWIRLIQRNAVRSNWIMLTKPAVS